MVKKEIRVSYSEHLERPVAMLVQVASSYESKVYIEDSHMRINAKSIMGMMTIGLVPGRVITVTAEGVDEEEAMAGVETFLREGA